MGVENFEPGFGPVGGFAESEKSIKKEPTELDIANLALTDRNILVARETLRNDPEKAVVHLAEISEFDNAVAVELSSNEYVFFVNESDIVRFIAVCNKAGLLTISKMAEAIRGLEREPKLSN